MVPTACSNPGVAGSADRTAMAGRRMLPDASGVGPSAFPQGSMDGSDIAGAAGCEDTHRSTPLPEPSGGGAAPVPGRAARPAPAERTADPQDAFAQAVARSWTCESRAGEHVNRPPCRSHRPVVA